jgi:hypothetical protein
LRVDGIAYVIFYVITGNPSYGWRRRTMSSWRCRLLRVLACERVGQGGRAVALFVLKVNLEGRGADDANTVLITVDNCNVTTFS